MKKFDLVVVGSGPAGLLASIVAARRGKTVVILEKLSKPSLKLKSTGGGRCNLTNRLSTQKFCEALGKNGKFFQNALEMFSKDHLIEFLNSIGLQVAIADGFRVFPKGHNSQAVLDAFFQELQKLQVSILTNHKVIGFLKDENKIVQVVTAHENFTCTNLLIASGGCGYPSLGGDVNGFEFIKSLGHKVTKLYPAMLPLHTQESWVSNCTSDTVAKATIKIDIKKYSKLKLTGDLIFTKNGIRGPLVLDFARYITPLLEELTQVPVLVNLTGGKNEDQIGSILKQSFQQNPQTTILDNLLDLLPQTIAQEFLNMCQISKDERFNKIEGVKKDKLIKLLAWTPLTIIGSDGFDKAMVTKGGVSLKQIDPSTMQSKLYSNLYFAGEVIDLDGPCGGFNLQIAFSTAFVAASSIH